MLDDARHQPYMDEWIVGARRQLPGLVTVDASVVRREFKDRTALVEINGIYENGVFKGYKNESFNDIYKITNNEWNWPVYTFFELQGTKQTERFQALASYTHQWRHLAGTWQPNDPASFIQPDAFPNSKGIGSTTSTFESQNSLSSNANVSSLQVQTVDDTLRLGASYRGPWDIMLATNYVQSDSGRPSYLHRGARPPFRPPTVTLSNGRVVSEPARDDDPVLPTRRGRRSIHAAGHAHLERAHRQGHSTRRAASGSRRRHLQPDQSRRFLPACVRSESDVQPAVRTRRPTSNASSRADLGAVHLLRRQTRS